MGLTEGTPISINPIGGIKVGTVGPPIPGMEVKTTAEGELWLADLLLWWAIITVLRGQSKHW